MLHQLDEIFVNSIEREISQVVTIETAKVKSGCSFFSPSQCVCVQQGVYNMSNVGRSNFQSPCKHFGLLLKGGQEGGPSERRRLELNTG